MTSPDASRRVIAVVGPTATGKTAIGIDLAERLNTGVISADSRVIYRELDIGTAKPTPEEIRGVPHHMIDVADPPEVYSVARYAQEAGAVLEDMFSRGRVPVVVGGTGFYIRALLETDFLPDVPPDEDFRARMTTLAEAHGSPHLHELLREKDPVRAAALHPNDRFRVIRALEIVERTGRPVPSPPAEGLPFGITWIGLAYADRRKLWQRINDRIDAMLTAGWLDEVEGLLAKYGPDAEALRVTHGYPELVQVAQGRRSLEDAVEQIRINIRQYSRRQMTWFRKNSAIQWFAVDELSSDDLRRACMALAVSSA